MSGWASLAGGDRGASDEGGDGGRRRRRALGRGFPGRRVARGVATQGEAPGGDPGSQSAFGATRALDDERGREPGRTAIPGAGGPTSGAYGEPEPKAQSNFTDPESQIMKTSSEGFQQCYNAQMAVDGEHQIIVALRWGHRPATRVSWWGCSTRSTRRLGSSLRWYWPMRATATSRICWSWKIAASTRT